MPPQVQVRLGQLCPEYPVLVQPEHAEAHRQERKAPLAAKQYARNGAQRRRHGAGGRRSRRAQLPGEHQSQVQRAANADVWINGGGWKSLPAMLEDEPRYVAFKAYRQGQVWTYERRQQPSGAGLRPRPAAQRLDEG